jgi:hypothetical protein
MKFDDDGIAFLVPFSKYQTVAESEDLTAGFSGSAEKGMRFMIVFCSADNNSGLKFPNCAGKRYLFIPFKMIADVPSVTVHPKLLN